MGLLDDAIREHLDLKRRRGADPTEIERAEREALGPVRRDPVGGEEIAPPLEIEPGGYSALEDFEDEEWGPGDDSAIALEPPLHDESMFGDEPAFADEPVLGEARAVGHEQAPAPPAEKPSGLRGRFRGRRRHEPPAVDEPPPEAAAPDDGDSFEYETYDVELGIELVEPAAPSPAASVPPREPPTPTPQEAPSSNVPPAPPPRPPVGDETVEYQVEPIVEEEGGDDEDVLEETPDFLQDTPEHDRLWFEQRPPRDFDFDG